MLLDNFYSFTSPEEAKDIFGQRAHFHWAVPSDTNDPFDQAVIDLFPYIKPNSKILDCGCGWGGPGRIIQEHLNCEVTVYRNNEFDIDNIGNFYFDTNTDKYILTQTK